MAHDTPELHIWGAYIQKMSAVEKTKQDREPLLLTTVLFSSLPPNLFTDESPAKYTVDAVFNRRVEASEISAIESFTSLNVLSRSGFGDVALEVQDRRLRIHNTCLEQLRDGLATVIARLLTDIWTDNERERLEAVVVARADAERELERAQAVLDLAREVSFDANRVTLHDSEAKRDAEASAQGFAWDNEGGHNPQ
ncbi:hypothetical protein [Brevibacterium aurantiacum]|uniref:hypothetical protein n=1 Tax=Brevibacterium aurantiacum TaxID=273384 RepID=UPI001642C687|nr:hypothetical protein [Brevibacterium aurantiacum]